MNKIIALAITAVAVAAASPSFAASVDLMNTYWFGR